MPRVVHIRALDDPVAAPFREAAEGRFEFVTVPSDASARDLAPALEGAEVLVTGVMPLPVSAAELPESLRLIQLAGCGADSLDLAALIERGVTIGANPPEIAETAADHAFGLLLASLQIDRFAGIRTRSEIQVLLGDDSAADELAGRAVGMIGLGRVGARLARRIAEFGARVVYSDIRTPPPHVTSMPGLRRMTTDMLLTKSDVVSVNVPWGPAANPTIGSREVRLLSDDAILVNASYCRVVDEQSVGEALGRGRLGAYAAYVPHGCDPPEGHPLRDSKKAILVSGAAGLTPEATAAAGRRAAENVELVLAGEAPRSVIEPLTFPRAGDPAFWSSRLHPARE